MKDFNFPKYLLTLLCVSISAASNSQNFKLIDINKTKNSNPSNYEYSSMNMFAELDGVFYFSADDGIHGTELYSSDGTASGTKLVKDIMPGTASSNPYDIIASGNKIYFIASNSQNEQEVWVSDGTDAGTTLLAANITGTGYSYIQYLTDVNGTLFFTKNGNELWKSDGTPEGTVLVTSLNGYGYSPLVNVNGKVLFSFYDYNTPLGNELYVSDGTAEGTTLVADINPNPYAGSNPSHLTALNGLLYFSADDGTGTRLYVSDGTPAGTHPLKNMNDVFLPPSYGSYQLEPFAVKNKTLFFQGTTSASGYELYKYNTSDTVNNNVTLVKDIVAGENSSYPSFMTNVNGTLYFTIGPAGADAQLWKSDGTKAGTVLVKDINPGGQNYYYGLIDFNGTLLFAYANETSGFELWKSNGTNAGTVILKDILPGDASSYPGFFTYKNGKFLFNANGPQGFELWTTDGTTAGTVMVKDINHTSTSSSNPAAFAALPDNKVIFNAYDGKNPGNLFVTDGSAAGTKRVDANTSVNIYVNGYNSPSTTNQQAFFSLNNTTYFIDYSNHLWKTDGTNAGTLMLPIPALTDSSGYTYVLNVLATDSLLYVFEYNYSTSKVILWRSDGTAEGTYIIKSDISSNYNLYPTVVGNTLFFANSNSDISSSELWKTDGTVAGTNLVKIISSYNYNPLTDLVSYNGKLYFNAYTPTNSFGPSLWTSDGTDAGTHVVKEVAVIQQPFGKANGKLFFYALDAISKGYELYVTDGTSSGTRIVKDINSGAAPSNTYNNTLVNGDTLLYFIANDGKHGSELWKSNGTSAGTKLVRDITPGLNDSYFNSIVNVKDKLFFTVNDTLWHSNGTREGTAPVKDENLKGVSNFQWLRAIGDSLYFSAYSYAAGQELYVGSTEINLAPKVRITSPTDDSTYKTGKSIVLSADASDKDGTIKMVQFFNGNILIGTESDAPYYRKWYNVPPGSYTITAKATDNNGAVTVSAPVHITVADNQPPVVTITSPVNGSGYLSPATIILSANANDPDGTIKKVEFYKGSTLLATENYARYFTYWRDVPEGTYTITAKATDDNGSTSVSEPVTVTVSSQQMVRGASSVNDQVSLNGLSTIRGISDGPFRLNVSPNPASNLLSIYMQGLPSSNKSVISVLSVSGVTIKSIQSNSVNKIQMDVSALNAGTYYIKVLNGDKVLYKPFVKL